MNLVRMNLYRFVRTKAVYVIMLVTVLSIGLVVLDQKSMSQEAWEAEMELLQQEGISTEDTGMTPGINFGMTPIRTVTEMSESYIGSGMLLVLIGIFAALFSNAERTGGYLKNLNSCSQNRSWIFMAKAVPVVVFAGLNIVLIPVMSAVFGLDTSDAFSKEAAYYLLIQWLLHAAFGMFVLTIMEMSRSLVVGMLIGIFSGMGIGVLLLSFLEGFFNGNGFFTSHMLVHMVRAIVVENVTSSLLAGVLTGIIGFLLYLVLGTYVFKKRDMC